MGVCYSNGKTHLVKLNNFLVFQERWNIDKDTCIGAHYLASKDHLHVHAPLTTTDKMILFCYAKQIISLEDSHLRHQELVQLQLLPPHLPPFTHHPYTQPEPQSKMFERLHRIVEIGETSKQNANAFDEFVIAHPEWNQSNSWVLFRDHPSFANKNAYVQRIQLSGNCYMHGPVVMQHYLVAMNQKEPVGMIDIADYLRKHMQRDALKNHIFQDTGGHSIEFLRHILGLETYEYFEKPDVKSEDIPLFLTRFGCGLISSMVIYSNIYDSSTHLISPRTSGDTKVQGYHAMVLVGYRRDPKTQELRYLLQNWWKNLSFLDVNSHYLRACNAILTFVNLPQFSIPQSFSTNFHRHVEATHDSCEMLPLER
jgi:hypothetical protein